MLLKREEILNAAAKIFAQKGYHHATMVDVADEVDLLKGSLYYYFSSKESLLLEVIKRGMDSYKETLRKIQTSSLSPVYKMQQAFLAHLKPFSINLAELTVFLREGNNLSPELAHEMKNLIREYETMLFDLIKEGSEGGYFRRDLDYKLAVYAMLGMCNWLYRWYDPAGRSSIEEIAKQFSLIFLDGLKEHN